MKKLVSILESELYNKDTDFDTEEAKDGYYNGEFWQDSDFVSYSDNKVSRDILIVSVDDEIIFHDMWGELELSKEENDMIEQFYNSDYKKYFTPLKVGNDYNFKDDENYKKELPKLWFRGGSGYYYYCHQYNQNIENRSINKEY